VHHAIGYLLALMRSRLRATGDGGGAAYADDASPPDHAAGAASTIPCTFVHTGHSVPLAVYRQIVQQACDSWLTAALACVAVVLKKMVAAALTQADREDAACLGCTCSGWGCTRSWWCCGASTRGTEPPTLTPLRGLS